MPIFFLDLGLWELHLTISAFSRRGIRRERLGRKGYALLLGLHFIFRLRPEIHPFWSFCELNRRAIARHDQSSGQTKDRPWHSLTASSLRNTCTLSEPPAIASFAIVGRYQ